MAKRYVKSPNSPIPDYPPDPEVQARVRAALGLDRPRKPPPPEMAESLPAGLSEAPMPEPPQELRMPPPTPPLVRRPEDETTPAFGKITRVNDADLMKMEWLIPRLCEHFPDISANAWHSRLRIYMHENGYLFVRNERAVALAYVARDLFSTKPYVAPIFVVHADRDRPTVDDEGGALDAIRLFREIVRWAKGLGATEVRNCQAHSDVPPGRIREQITGGDRREEIFIRLK
jgi:hypothetical protein